MGIKSFGGEIVKKQGSVGRHHYFQATNLLKVSISSPHWPKPILLAGLVFVLARFAGGLVAGFVGAGYGWLLGLLSALLVGAAAGPSIRLRHSGQV